jgi:hypothetical protein
MCLCSFILLVLLILYERFRTAGGVVFNKKATKIDQEGCQDLLTGERNQHILKTDIQVSTAQINVKVRRNPR